MSDNKQSVTMEDIVSLCKRRGFIYQGSEVYGGLAGTWDYGPLGVMLKRNIMNLWWKMFVEDRDDMYGVDAAILMNQKVWQASGHTNTFTDPLTTCMDCNSRQRVDKIVDPDKYQTYLDEVLKKFYVDQVDNYQREKANLETLKSSMEPLTSQVDADFQEYEKLKKAGVKAEVYKSWLEGAYLRLQDDMENQKTLGKGFEYIFTYIDMLRYILDKTGEARSYLGEYARNYLNLSIKCPVCESINWSKPQKFNMMFKTTVGPVDDEGSVSYLRPETAQGIFTNFKNVVDSFSPDLPFGIAQQGKAFRNEISPRDFVFRSREFEQMEIEYFIDPETWEELFDQWVKDIQEFLKALNLPKQKVHLLEVPEEDRAHYSKRTIDIEYDFPHGRDELLGLAYRTDFDLGNIERVSKKKQVYIPKEPGLKPFVPHVIEPSFGVERAIVAVLASAYVDDKQNERVVLKLPTHLAPYKFAVSPLLKNKPELVEKAREVYLALKKQHGNVTWDDNGNIGKRYRRQDEIGTPNCVVIDFQTLEDGTVTVRDRDTTEQKRVSIKELTK